MFETDNEMLQKALHNFAEKQNKIQLIGDGRFYHGIMCPKYADGITKSVDPDSVSIEVV